MKKAVLLNGNPYPPHLIKKSECFRTEALALLYQEMKNQLAERFGECLSNYADMTVNVSGRLTRMANKCENPEILNRIKFLIKYISEESKKIKLNLEGKMEKSSCCKKLVIVDSMPLGDTCWICSGCGESCHILQESFPSNLNKITTHAKRLIIGPDPKEWLSGKLNVNPKSYSLAMHDIQEEVSRLMTEFRNDLAIELDLKLTKKDMEFVESKPLSKPDCSNHPDHVKNYNGTLRQLANDIGDLRYDKQAELYSYLTEKLAMDSTNDRNDGRLKLSLMLRQMSWQLVKLKESTLKAWEICKPYMK